MNHEILIGHYRLFVLLAAMLIWLIYLWIKWLNPMEFYEIIRRPTVMYHRYKAKGFRLVLSRKITTHLLWLLWLSIYFMSGQMAFPQWPFRKMLYLFAGWYLAEMLFFWIAGRFHPGWKAFRYMRLFYTQYVVFWLSILVFALVFLWIPYRWSWILMSVAFVFFGLQFNINVLKVGYLEWNIRRVYIILYLCTMEIIPIAVIVSYLI